MEQVLIIAEAGVNHNGDIRLAKRLVDEAGECGADIVKFQTAKLDSLVTKHAPMAAYQKDNTGSNGTQRQMLEKLLLSYVDFKEISVYCQQKQIEFLSTPFDVESIHFLEPYVRFWKVPSGEINNLPYLREIAKTKKQVILSTGMSDLREIDQAVSILYQYGTQDIILLHCTTNYPADFKEVNLNAMQLLKETFHVPVGYSDHTKGIEVAVAAVAMGARVIEKHFTLDKTMEGPDHKASLEPCELKQMVCAIRNVELALGKRLKEPVLSEKKNIVIARKSIVAKRDIQPGELFSEDNITTKRPATGLSPMLWDQITGTRARRAYKEDEMIEL